MRIQVTAHIWPLRIYTLGTGHILIVPDARPFDQAFWVWSIDR